ncbi:MAG: hypothetical protein CFH21_00248 [Alphaproteobacteria bacterium MarineAlpha5_Bin11]|nr:hypothetical protein [Pelagibacteraceae bacterium]PPR44660.1 MAG: hypothetical protein CFH21_00248 [Alphaproteobacteria bacterium MarineAlpha5_Bin11]PPR51210.1 MAG: hypothetical protein CFH20_00738 [Alphaproteobacteria bacterium MarineAlpha5_Bin10]|tara:strand:+ start:9917 stop:12463 length:2547 start_codon:yes stop_codon:yes gene_type:complete
MRKDNLDINLKAILGPTNTGKTHLAFERMLSFQSGVFGFPLRLLARENYDKALQRVGENFVALITGEEKIVPKSAKYFFCTVESMPQEKDFEFVAIDEVQLAADFERGYIFTNSMLKIRGFYETIFIGSLVIGNILKELFPKISIESRNRFSKLSFLKKKSISKLKPKTAIIAFNVNDVYSIAESIRSQKGGAAVVLGALSPRTRNSQVEMFENEEVQYLVATDAIGMGLNLNIDHVAFSSLKKFDGKLLRNLNLNEIGQIAGRAGRYKNDGTFGVTGNAYDLDPLSVDIIENHKYENLKKIYWRNSDIDFQTLRSVFNSLNKNPEKDIFIKKKNAEDEIKFKILSKDKNIIRFLNSPKNIQLLWNVCQIPDFQKLLTESHSDFLKKFFLHLMNNDYLLPELWIKENIQRLDNINGDIDTLSKRIAHVRTWTFISNHPDWIKNNEYWQEITRNIEDKLSDELHNKLKSKFVEEQSAYFVDKSFIDGISGNHIRENSQIMDKSSKVDYLNNFKLLLDQYKNNNKSVSSFNETKKTIFKMIPERVSNLLKAPDDAFNLGDISKMHMGEQINIYWGGEAVAYLEKGKNVFSPNVNILNSDLLEHNDRQKIKKRLQDYIENKIGTILNPINRDTNFISESSVVRSVAYNLFHDLGCSKKSKFLSQISKLSDSERKELSNLGVRTGIEYFYIPNFMKKNSIELKAFLWKIYHSFSKEYQFPLPKDGRVYFDIKDNLGDLPLHYWNSIGYLKIRKIAVRVDIFERLSFLVRQKNKLGPFSASPELMNLLGCTIEKLQDILLFLNYESITMGNERILFVQKRDKSASIKNNKGSKKIKNISNESPFAVLGSYFNK